MELTPPIRVLALGPHQQTHYGPLHHHDGIEVIETGDFDRSKVRDLKPDLVITITPEYFQSNECVQVARELSIPSLLLLDGILEWRHQWTNIKLGSGGGLPFAQPAPTDKIACFGWQNARTLENWGNVGKCEIIGVPRFDHYISMPVQHVEHDRPRRLLIMTANTPGFTPDQIEMTKQALSDVREYLSQQSDWEPIWRVRGGLDEALGLSDQFTDLRGKPLRDVFAQADAVLTTPSTVVLEAMLARLPTALLDYSNSPNYISAAWSITAQAHIAPILEDMLQPSANRLLFQDEMLHNQLECRTPATDRMVELIKSMTVLGREARASGKALSVPARILPLELGGHTLPPQDFDFAALYPEHPVFKNKDMHALQFEVTSLRAEVKHLRTQLQARGVGYWLRRTMVRLREKSPGAR